MKTYSKTNLLSNKKKIINALKEAISSFSKTEASPKSLINHRDPRIYVDKTGRIITESLGVKVHKTVPSTKSKSKIIQQLKEVYSHE